MAQVYHRGGPHEHSQPGSGGHPERGRSQAEQQSGDRDPVGGHADLSGVHERREGGGVDRVVDVGVVLRGPHFTAIAYGPGAARDLGEFAWPTAGARLKRLVVGPSAADGLAFSDPGKTLRRAYGLTGDTLLLIRPDGYIGHIATRDFFTTTHTAVRAMTP